MLTRMDFYHILAQGSKLLKGIIQTLHNYLFYNNT